MHFIQKSTQWGIIAKLLIMYQMRLKMTIVADQEKDVIHGIILLRIIYIAYYMQRRNISLFASEKRST